MAPNNSFRPTPPRGVAQSRRWASRERGSCKTNTPRNQTIQPFGFGIADHLKLVPVDFEAGDNWLERLVASGFDAKRPAVVTSTGVSMYLTKDAIMETMRKIATFASGSTFVMSFLCPIEILDPEIRTGVERAAEGARASGTPWISFFKPDEIMALAREAGIEKVWHVSAAALAERYFAGRTDGLRSPDNSEELLLATVRMPTSSLQPTGIPLRGLPSAVLRR